MKYCVFCSEIIDDIESAKTVPIGLLHPECLKDLRGESLIDPQVNPMPEVDLTVWLETKIEMNKCNGDEAKAIEDAGNIPQVSSVDHYRRSVMYQHWLSRIQGTE